ncbi:MAG: hypothetical protein QXW97_01905 [Candidatus Pacearchaeota archaeon]
MILFKKYNYICNKKGLMSIATVLLVLLTLVLIGVALGNFVLNERKQAYYFELPVQIYYMNNEVLRLDFYLQELFDKALKEMKPDFSPQDFINKYIENMENYKPREINIYKSQILRELNFDNIFVDNDKITFKINILISKESEDKNFKVSYIYRREFVKKLS